MTNFVDRKTFNRFDRWAMRVADLMTRSPQSIRADATIRESINFLAEKDVTAAPVINEAGRPIGVLSLSDLVTAASDHGIEDETFFNTQASKLMTPFVFFVNADTPVHNVVGELLDCQVRQMYVADHDGVLVGVLNTADLLQDILRHIEEQCADGCATAA